VSRDVGPEAQRDARYRAPAPFGLGAHGGSEPDVDVALVGRRRRGLRHRLDTEAPLCGDAFVELAKLVGEPVVTVKPGVSCEDRVLQHGDPVDGLGPSLLELLGLALAVAFPGLSGSAESPGGDGGFTGCLSPLEESDVRVGVAPLGSRCWCRG
jgi:hypothetical protein